MAEMRTFWPLAIVNAVWPATTREELGNAETRLILLCSKGDEGVFADRRALIPFAGNVSYAIKPARRQFGNQPESAIVCPIFNRRRVY